MESTRGRPPPTIEFVSLAANSSDTEFWMILIMVPVAIFFHWLARGSFETEIRLAVNKLGAKLIRVRWLPLHDLEDRHNTCYDVTLQLPSGRQFSAVCKCNATTGIYWESSPWAQELLQEPPPAVEAVPKSTRIFTDCTRCGYGIQQGWVMCPNCGTEVAS